MGELHLRGCNSPGRVAPTEVPVALSGVRVAPLGGASRTFQVASGPSDRCESHISGSEWSL